MAVLVAKAPQKRYQVIGGIGLSEADVAQADKLDGRMEARIRKLVDRLTQQEHMPSEKGKGSLRTYWELGVPFAMSLKARISRTKRSCRSYGGMPSCTFLIHFSTRTAALIANIFGIATDWEVTLSLS